MFKHKKKKTGVQTPEFRKPPAPPPPPTSGSNAVKPNQNYVPPASVKKLCPYELPCGWCTKWDKKCDKKMPERGLRAKGNFIEDAADFSYGKCLGCDHYGWHIPQCAECNPENGFKYFEEKENNND